MTDTYVLLAKGSGWIQDKNGSWHDKTEKFYEPNAYEVCVRLKLIEYSAKSLMEYFLKENNHGQ